MNRGFVIGGYLYAGIALLVAGIACYALWQRGEAANERADAAESKVSELTQALADGEAQIEALRVAAEVLDRQLVEINRRERALNDQKRALARQLDEIASRQSAEDQACYNRELPDAIAERLRNQAFAANQGGEAARSRVPAGSVPQVRP